MRDRENASRFRGVWAQYLRGFRLLSRVVPGLSQAIVLHSAVAALTPYVTIWLFSRVLTVLETRSSSAWTQAWIALGAEVGLLVVGAVFRRRKEAKWDMLYRATERLLADTMLNMDHTAAESPLTAEALARAKESMNALGSGLVQLPDILQNWVWGSLGIVASVVSLHGIFCVDGMMGGLCLSSLIAASALSWWLSTRSERLHKHYTDEVVHLDRHYYAFYDTVFDREYAADMRLYQQDHRVLQRLENIETLAFQKQGYKYKRSHSVCGWLQALSALPYALWVGGMCFCAAFGIGGAFGLGVPVQVMVASVWAIRDIEKLRWGVTHAFSNREHLERLYRFLDIPPQMYRGSLTTEKRSDHEYTLEVKGISFRYPSATHDALTDIHVRLDSGKRIAIVGRNGSGKSTFLKLLSRLYDPYDGEILLNGIDIRKYRYEEYSALLSAVFQEVRMLHRSVAENVACDLEYDRERVIQCLDAVELKVDADRMVDESFSGSDEQKLAMARALYKGTPFILLDEPTAALDPAAETSMYASFDRLIGDRTAVYVSHRLSVCRFCDEILVFEKGRIVQRGSHDELVVDRDGPYYRLWSAQAQYYI